MDIQRVQSGNSLYTPTLSFPSPVGTPVNSNVASTPWLAPEMNAANDALRNFWANFAPPPSDDPMPFFGRFMQNAGTQNESASTAIGEGDGAQQPAVLHDFTPVKQRNSFSDAVGEGDGALPPGFTLPGFGEPAKPRRSFSDAIGEGDGAPPTMAGGNTGDAGAPGRRESFTMAIGEGDTRPDPVLVVGNTGDAGAPGRRGSFTMAIGEGDTLA